MGSSLPHHSERIRPPAWFIGLCLGGLIGIVIFSIYGIGREIAAGETEPGEMFQWGVLAGMPFGFSPGAILGALLGLAVDKARRQPRLPD